MVALESVFPVVPTNENCVPFISGFRIAVADCAGRCIAHRIADA